jgi:steroid 5-alpha reductase family enzyme
MTTQAHGTGHERRKGAAMADAAHDQRWTRRGSFALIVVIYVLAIGAFVAGASVLGIDQPEWAILVGYLCSTALLYVPSQIVGNGSTFDAWWSVIPPAAAVWLMVVADHPGDAGLTVVVRWVTLLLVLAWGVRLTGNWALGWTGLDHEDWRYRQLYEQMPTPRWLTSLLTVHLFPTVTVAVASLPMVAVFTRTDDSTGWPTGGTVLFVLGALVTAGAILIEHLADVELRAFNRRKQPGDIIDTGWWGRSRHPNYLGEMGFWWGLGLMAVAVDTGAWWTLLGPLVITVMFLTASIPLLETRSAERRPGWDAYAARVPTLLPRLRPR